MKRKTFLPVKFSHDYVLCLLGACSCWEVHIDWDVSGKEKHKELKQKRLTMINKYWCIDVLTEDYETMHQLSLPRITSDCKLKLSHSIIVSCSMLYLTLSQAFLFLKKDLFPKQNIVLTNSKINRKRYKITLDKSCWQWYTWVTKCSIFLFWFSRNIQNR